MGRPKGSMNRPKRALINLLNEKYPGYHPVLSMADIANDMSNGIELRAQMHKEIAQYVTPKLKAVEIDTINHEPVRVEIVQYSQNTEQPGE